MELHTPRLTLREFRDSDFAAVRAYELDPRTHLYEPPIPDGETVRERLRQAALWALEAPRTHYRLAITIPPDDSPRGHISLTLTSKAIREWEIGWLVHPDYWGKGYATEAAKQMLQVAFSSLDAHRVVAFSHVLDVASRRVMEKCGMVQEGLLRETRRLNGAWSDEVVYAILEREWALLGKQMSR